MRWAPEVMEYLRTRVRRNRFGDFWSLRDASSEMERVTGWRATAEQIRRWEKGLTVPRVDWLAIICTAYDVPPDVLFVPGPHPLLPDEVRSLLIARKVIR